MEDQPRLSHHILAIENAEASLVFYQQQLGMTLVDRVERQNHAGTETAYFLGYTSSPATLLELRHRTGSRDSPYRHDKSDGYWKIGITLPDVDLARERLLAAGIDVSLPTQFRDIGYLCHLKDPTGFNIELLQHDFAENFRSAPADPRWPLGGVSTLGQITLRIKDPALSLPFYCALLGMKLLSRQEVSFCRFTLYFLACCNEQPPCADLDAVENREWLWKRPYTTLELQHNWGTEASNFHYTQQVDDALGFHGIRFVTPELPEFMERLARAGFPIAEDRDLGGRETCVHDPDGHPIYFSSLV